MRFFVTIFSISLAYCAAVIDYAIEPKTPIITRASLLTEITALKKRGQALREEMLRSNEGNRRTKLSLSVDAAALSEDALFDDQAALIVSYCRVMTKALNNAKKIAGRNNERKLAEAHKILLDITTLLCNPSINQIVEFFERYHISGVYVEPSRAVTVAVTLTRESLTAKINIFKRKLEVLKFTILREVSPTSSTENDAINDESALVNLYFGKVLPKKLKTIKDMIDDNSLENAHIALLEIEASTSNLSSDTIIELVEQHYQ